MRLRTLWETSVRRHPPELPDALRALYGSDLVFPAQRTPYVYANFVASADGVVSFGVRGQAGGGTISGGNLGDRLGMALLRARADAVLVGARTLRAAGRPALWDPAYTFPAATTALRAWRRARGLTDSPLLTVVTASGRLPLDYEVFHARGARVLVLSSDGGAARLRAEARRRGLKLELRVLAPVAGRMPVRAMLRLLAREFGVRMLLCEGGPTLFGELARAGLVQELFLSVAPVLAGRNGRAPRPGPIVGAAFAPARAPRMRLLSVKAHGDLLLLRYRITGSGARPSSR
ncbi:MAG: dihydrofolate reductase family protein [Terriglobales bacterium]